MPQSVLQASLPHKFIACTVRQLHCRMATCFDRQWWQRVYAVVDLIAPAQCTTNFIHAPRLRQPNMRCWRNFSNVLVHLVVVLSLYSDIKHPAGSMLCSLQSHPQDHARWNHQHFWRHRYQHSNWLRWRPDHQRGIVQQYQGLCHKYRNQSAVLWR